jgi:hypothetical protein
MDGEIGLEAIDSTGASGACFPEFFSQRHYNMIPHNLHYRRRYFLFMGMGRGVFSICLRRRERVERRCHIDETDKMSEKYYPKTLIIKIVQNHSLFVHYSSHTRVL